MQTVQILNIFAGLMVAGGGSAVLNNWGGAALAWRRFDDMFPPQFRTPAPFAGVSLYTLGATVALLSLLAV